MRSALREIRRSEAIEGSLIAFDAREGRFSYLVRALSARASDAQIEKMIHDEAPSVRLAGYLIGIERWPLRKERLLSQAAEDQGQVTFLYGCDPFGELRSLAELLETPDMVVRRY